MSIDGGINGTETTRAVVQTNSTAIRRKTSAPKDDVDAFVAMRNQLTEELLTKRAGHTASIAEHRKAVVDIDEKLRLIGAPAAIRMEVVEHEAQRVEPPRDVDDSISGSPPSAARKWHKHPDGTREEVALAIVNKAKRPVNANQVRARFRSPQPTRQGVATVLAVLTQRVAIRRVGRGLYAPLEATQ